MTTRFLVGRLLVLALCLLALCSCGEEYESEEAAESSSEVRQSLELVRRIAGDPQAVDSSLSDGASRKAHGAVSAAARRMASAEAVERGEATWFGDYLRLIVVCRLEGGRTRSETFLLRKEKGEMRITGVESP